MMKGKECIHVTNSYIALHLVYTPDKSLFNSFVKISQETCMYYHWGNTISPRGYFTK